MVPQTSHKSKNEIIVKNVSTSNAKLNRSHPVSALLLDLDVNVFFEAPVKSLIIVLQKTVL